MLPKISAYIKVMDESGNKIVDAIQPVRVVARYDIIDAPPFYECWVRLNFTMPMEDIDYGTESD